jgi:hypothetical protein
MGDTTLRLRVDKLALIGPSGTLREVELRPGLNIIHGPITTGKTTFMRLLRAVLGGGISDMPPEVKEHVTTLAASLLIGDLEVSVVRPNVTTNTAMVELATAAGEVQRLPALAPDRSSPVTYGQWLLDKLGLPDLRVPQAPTKRDSADVQLSINDFLNYCRLAQDEIDTEVFGSDHHQKNTKRMQVFEVLYGLYDIATATLEAERRDIVAELRVLEAGSKSFERYLTDTPWSNRAQLEQRLASANERLAQLNAEQQQITRTADRSDQALELRARVQHLEQRISDAVVAGERERQSVIELDELLSQLETQAARLTKSIVAGSSLYDLEFKVCPRCAAPLNKDMADPDLCYVCCNPPKVQFSRDDLVAEQQRLTDQILETEQLAQERRESSQAIEKDVVRFRDALASANEALDRQQHEFVSRHADEIAALARERAAVESEIRQVIDYLTLFTRLDSSAARVTELEERRDQIDGDLEQAKTMETATRQRLDALTANFAKFVDVVGVPELDGEPRAAIASKTYMPILSGRRFPELSSGGLKVLVNVAHTLAHQATAIEQELPLPNILLLDGVTKNVGRDDYDQERVNAVFDVLAQLADRWPDRLQIIVAVNDYPPGFEDRVVLRLTQDDRLIPIPPKQADDA